MIEFSIMLRHFLPILISVATLVFSQNANAQYHVEVIAGKGIKGFSGDNAVAANAAFCDPIGVAVDSKRNVYVADACNNRIRKINAQTHIITTVAGTDTAGYNGDSILAITAQLNYPWAIAVDSADNLYIADQYNSRIRKVSAITGMITTVAGRSPHPYEDSIPATSAALNGPMGIAVDRKGNLYISDPGNRRVRMVSATTGLMVTIAGNGMRGYNGDNIPATSAQLNDPHGITLYGTDPDGSARYLYIADQSEYRVRKIDMHTGIITTVAGTGVEGYNGDNIPADSVHLEFYINTATDSLGNLFIADGNFRVREVSNATGLITTIAGTGESGYNFDSGNASAVKLSFLGGIALDAAGNIYFSDNGNSRIRKLIKNSNTVHDLISQPLILYPNPARDAVTIQLQAGFPVAGWLAICDLAGRTLQSEPLTGAQTRIGLGGLATGVYLLRIRTADGQTFSQKLVKE